MLSGLGHPLAHLRTSPADPAILYGVILDGTSPLRVARSEDGGATWRIAAGGLSSQALYDLLPDALDARRLYAATSAGPLETDDGGESWHALGRGAGPALITGFACDPRSPGLLYAASSGGGLLRLRLER